MAEVIGIAQTARRIAACAAVLLCLVIRQFNAICSFISEDDYENVLTTRCTWICPKCDFFNFSDSLRKITAAKTEEPPFSIPRRLFCFGSLVVDLELN